MEQRNELFLQIAAQVDQQVAATDQVQLGEGRILDHVLLGENQHVANVFFDAKDAVIRLGREEARQPLRRKVGGDGGRIDAGAGRGNGVAVDVRGKHLHIEVLFHRLLAFGQEDGQGIGLLSGGAPRGPDTDGGIRRLAGEEFGDDLFLQRLEGFGIAEETGHADQHVTEQGVHFIGRLVDEFDVTLHGFDLVHGHAPLNTALDGGGFVLRKVVPGPGAQQE